MKGGLSVRQAALKRGVDVVLSAAALLLLGWLVPVLVVLARRDTGGTGIYRQVRVGRDGELFEVLKIRTMLTQDEPGTTVTASDDPRITPLGAKLRRWKLDEIPQLWNVLRGDMSFVGPRPDVPGFYDRLEGDDRVLLSVRPGITSPAAVAYHNEEILLAMQNNPEEYNRQVVFPAKVAANRAWLESWSMRADIRCLWETVTSIAQSFGGRDESEGR